MLFSCFPKKQLATFFATLLAWNHGYALLLPNSSPLLSQEKVLLVNNRVLAKINGKPITVVDVMNKLDVVFYQRYPEYADSQTARCQFYQVAWRSILDDLIDKELLLAEAKTLKLEVSNGELRKELDKTFGPNVVANLHKIGMTYDQAADIIRGDMIIQRMMYVKVNAKVQKQITPKDIRAAYERYVESHPGNVHWTYRIISIRHPDQEKGAETAHLLTQAALKQPIEDLEESYPTLLDKENKAKVTFSDELTHKESELSEAYRAVLATLEPGAYSQPIAQKSRADRSVVFRVFYLKERVEEGTPSISELEAKLKQSLTNEAMERETALYLTQLRKKHGLDEESLKQRLSKDFTPFALK